MINIQKFESKGWQFDYDREDLVLFKSPRMKIFKCLWLPKSEATDNYLLDVELKSIREIHSKKARKTFTKVINRTMNLIPRLEQTN